MDPVTQRPTPLTDAQPPVLIYDENGQPYHSTLVDPDFARGLERENAELAEALQEVDEILSEMNWRTDRGLLQRVQQALARYNARRAG